MSRKERVDLVEESRHFVLKVRTFLSGMDVEISEKVIFSENELKRELSLLGYYDVVESLEERVYYGVDGLQDTYVYDDEDGYDTD